MNLVEAIDSLREEVGQCLKECDGCCKDIENNECTCRNAVILAELERKPGTKSTVTIRKITEMIRSFIDENPTAAECIHECGYEETDITDFEKNEIKKAMVLLDRIFGAYINDPGYAIADFDGTGMLEIQRINEAGIFESDDEAVEQAIKDGVKLIPVEELPENFNRKYLGWVDTPDNRDRINAWCNGIQ